MMHATNAPRTAPFTVTVDLPPRFYDDHVDRELPSGIEVKRTKNYVRVILDHAAYDDLLSDALYYVDAASDMLSGSPELLGLIASARATARRLSAMPVPRKPGHGGSHVEYDLHEVKAGWLVAQAHATYRTAGEALAAVKGLERQWSAAREGSVTAGINWHPVTASGSAVARGIVGLG